MGCVRLGEKIMKKDSICQVDVINQQNVTTATNYLEKEKVQKSLRILSKFTDNKQINIIFYLLAVEEHDVDVVLRAPAAVAAVAVLV